MELVKNIFFNTDKLIENTNVKVSYTGKFFQDNSETVVMHYGFGNNWDNVSDIAMNKTELGFQAEINILEGDTFNFCFKNETEEWDNNDSNNFVFNLEKQKAELVVLADEPSFLAPTNKLRKSYIWSKKVRLAVYKLITYLPRILSSNYKKKSNDIIAES